MYFPPAVTEIRRPGAHVEPQPISATLKLPPSVKLSNKDTTETPAERASRKSGYEADLLDTIGANKKDQKLAGAPKTTVSGRKEPQPGDKDYSTGQQNGFDHPEDLAQSRSQKGDTGRAQGKGEQRKPDTLKGLALAAAGELPEGLSAQELAKLLAAEKRAIEEELANRVLSDISEEGSVCASEDGHPPSRPFSMENLLEEGRDKTPTQEDYSIMMRPNRPLRLDIEEFEGDKGPASPRRKGKGTKGLKSPVRQSPTKEQVMECIVASAKSILSPTNKKEFDDLGPRVAAAKREAELARRKDDEEFDQLMQDVERMKNDFKRRLSDIKNGYEKPKTDLDSGK